MLQIARGTNTEGRQAVCSRRQNDLQKSGLRYRTRYDLQEARRVDEIQCSSRA